MFDRGVVVRGTDNFFLKKQCGEFSVKFLRDSFWYNYFSFNVKFVNAIIVLVCREAERVLQEC
jgi:hypothetical protein